MESKGNKKLNPEVCRRQGHSGDSATKLDFSCNFTNYNTLKSIGLGQRAIFNELQEIKTFRNRIAHHEAICFDSKGRIDMTRTQNKYELILKYIAFLGHQSNHLFYGIDILPDSIIAKIEALK